MVKHFTFVVLMAFLASIAIRLFTRNAGVIASKIGLQG